MIEPVLAVYVVGALAVGLATFVGALDRDPVLSLHELVTLVTFFALCWPAVLVVSQHDFFKEV